QPHHAALPLPHLAAGATLPALRGARGGDIRRGRHARPFLRRLRRAAVGRMMRRGARLGTLGVVLWLACIACAHALEYFPGADWQHREPAQEGFDGARLKDAIDFAIASESKLPRDLSVAHYMTFGREPFGVAVGPFRERGAPTGVILRHGYIVAEWGEPARVDMAFSVTKSFLSSVVGVAFDRGMIASLDDPVARYMPPVMPYALPGASEKSDRLGHTELLQPFETPHNRTIT